MKTLKQEKLIKLYEVYFRKHQLEARENKKQGIKAYRITKYRYVLDRILKLLFPCNVILVTQNHHITNLRTLKPKFKFIGA